jgi:rfaE bifunctional protein nucleotidyltransferase chain/domain
MEKAIFLDRDGTLNEDSGYTYLPEDFRLLPGVAEGLVRLKGYKLFIVTNQSGIGRGYYTEADMHAYNRRMLLELERSGICIERIYFCPHTPEEGCDCRKPSPTFLIQAQQEYGIDFSQSYVIGDHPSDILLAQNTGCRGIYLLTGHGGTHLAEARAANPAYVAADFTQAADFILAENGEKIVAREKVKPLAHSLKQAGKKIVTLNGAFDILHKGHEKILTEAKKQGDILIVGVNSDASVRSNKGPERPVNGEQSRARMLACFEFVDFVTIFEEKTPISLLAEIRPDVHVNGAEYGQNCIERDVVERNGGRIHLVDRIAGYSTTDLLKGEGEQPK